MQPLNTQQMTPHMAVELYRWNVSPLFLILFVQISFVLQGMDDTDVSSVVSAAIALKRNMHRQGQPIRYAIGEFNYRPQINALLSQPGRCFYMILFCGK